MIRQYLTINQLPGEIWKPIPGYEGLYSVSNLGRVKSAQRETGTHPKEHLLRIHINKSGYAYVCLCRDGRPKYWTVHALVALAFIGTRPETYVINHLDGNKLNNQPGNIEYCTNAENMRHAADIGLMSSGEKHSQATKPKTPRGVRVNLAKLTDEKVMQIRAMYKTGQYTLKDIANEFQVSNQCVHAIVTGETWTHLPHQNERNPGKARGDRNGSRLHPDRLKRGEEHPRAVLTDDQVRQIRKEYTGAYGQLTDLARKYQLPRSTVWGVVNYKRYKHVI